MIVHNGEIENYEEIRKLILDNEIPLKTKTDSELIA